MTDLLPAEPTGTVVSVREPAPADAAALAVQAEASLAAWAQSLVTAHAIAQKITATTFVPAHFQGKPTDATVAIMKGAALGLDPVAALEAIYVVSGRAALYARAMVSVVLAAGHEVWTQESTDSSVTVCGRRAGADHTETSTWTIERAQRAGYTRNKKYESEPQAMLYAKAAAEVCRRIAPDAIAGLSYSAEDMELGDAKATTTIRRRRPQAEPVEVPTAELDTADTTEEAAA